MDNKIRKTNKVMVVGVTHSASSNDIFVMCPAPIIKELKLILQTHVALVLECLFWRPIIIAKSHRCLAFVRLRFDEPKRRVMSPRGPVLGPTLLVYVMSMALITS